MNLASPVVLAADDDASIRRLLKLELGQQGFRLSLAADGEEALLLFDRDLPDVVVLDLGMPDMDGFEVLRQMRARRQVPVIMLTAQGREADRVLGLDCGADDYLTKPFNGRELAARIRALRRRSGCGIERIVQCAGGVEIDVMAEEVRLRGEPVELTRSESRLLMLLASRPGAVFENDELLSQLWGLEHQGDWSFLRVWVARLRLKLAPEGSRLGIIKTFRGLGYLLEPIDPSRLN